MNPGCFEFVDQLQLQVSELFEQNGPRLVALVGASGTGKSSALRVLEDLGHETVDNPPLAVLVELITGPGAGPLAIGVDTRTRGFDPTALLVGLDALRARRAAAP